MSEAPAPPRPEADYDEAVPRRRTTLRLLLSIALALAAALALYLFQPGWFANPSAAPAHSHHTPVPTATPKPKVPPVPYLGEEQHFDNVSITPLDVTYTRGSGLLQANTGNVFAIVMLRIVNHTGTDYTLQPNVPCVIPYCNYFAVDTLGEKNPPVPYDPYHIHMRAVVLQDGGQQVGAYTFEVPERDAKAHALKLLYYPNPVLDATIVKQWLLAWPPRHGR